ncbi:MAG: hypothetical protein JWP24_2744 [Marmoricola sp.]|nr:hypothetical protein [Marmoricola sp.]
MSGCTLKPLGPDTRGAFAQLAIRHNGAWGSCWRIWSHPPCAGKWQSVEVNRLLKERLVNEGRARAALVFDGAVAVAS